MIRRKVPLKHALAASLILFDILLCVIVLLLVIPAPSTVTVYVTEPDRLQFTTNNHGPRMVFVEFTKRPTSVYVMETPNSVAQLKYQQTRRQERRIHEILHEIMRENASVVFDVGANEGTFTLVSAAYGAWVVAVEPQPSCRGALALSVAVNRFRRPPRIVAAVVGLDPRVTHRVSSEEACNGMRAFPATVAATARASEDETVPTLTLSSLLAPNPIVDAVHVDAEGAEISVLESGLQEIVDGRVRNLFVEINPGRWRYHGVSRAHGVQILDRVFSAMTCVDLADDAPVTIAERLVKGLSETVETDVWCQSRKTHM